MTGCDLYRRGLTELPPEICQCTTVRTLNLFGNNLTELPDAIGNLSNLAELNLVGLPPDQDLGGGRGRVGAGAGSGGIAYSIDGTSLRYRGPV